MSEFKGTKGKWKCNIHMSGDMTHEVRRVDSDNGIAICVVRTNNHDQSRSNAQLISKSPDMLAMLKKVLDNLSPEFPDKNQALIISEIEQLIKEATTI